MAAELYVLVVVCTEPELLAFANPFAFDVRIVEPLFTLIDPPETTYVPQSNVAPDNIDNDPPADIAKSLFICNVFVEEPVPILKIISLVFVPPAIELKV